MGRYVKCPAETKAKNSSDTKDAEPKIKPLCEAESVSSGNIVRDNTHTHTERPKHITKEKSKSKFARKTEEDTFKSQIFLPSLQSLAQTAKCCTLFTEQPSTCSLFCHLSSCISALEVVLPLTPCIFGLSYTSFLIGQLQFSSMNPSTNTHTAPTTPLPSRPWFTTFSPCHQAPAPNLTTSNAPWQWLLVEKQKIEMWPFQRQVGKSCQNVQPASLPIFFSQTT